MKSAVKILIASQILLLTACGPVPQNAQVAVEGILLDHEAMVKNFSNNASACFNPTIYEGQVLCYYIATYAHHTMTFVDILASDKENLKLQYKVPFADKNGRSCLAHQDLDPEKVKLYKTKNTHAKISDDDILIKDNDKKYESLRKLVIENEKNLGEICAEYRLFTTADPKMTYLIKYKEFSGDKLINPEPKTLSFYSSGTRMKIAK